MSPFNLDIIKHIMARITGSQSKIGLDQEHFGNAEAVQYYNRFKVNRIDLSIHPSLDFSGIHKIEKMIVNLTTNEEISLSEVEEFLSQIKCQFDFDFNMIYGHTIDNNTQDFIIDLFIY